MRSKRSRCIEPCRIASSSLRQKKTSPQRLVRQLRQLALDPDVAEPPEPVGHPLVEPRHRVHRPVAVGGRRRLRAHTRSLRGPLRLR